jgi:ATP-dependent Clp protease ATP-binding subunit ClpC
MTAEDGGFEDMKAKILEESKKHFRPEFLNRLDEQVVFHTLEKPALSQIVDLEVSKLEARLDEREMSLEIAADARDFLIEKGSDPEYGARPMRRAVERFLEDPLAEALLRGDVKEGDVIEVSLLADAKELTFKPKKQKKKTEPVA